MNREDLLFEYFEGGLDGQQEEMLFNQLQFDGTLREEFNQQMKILMLSRQDSAISSAPLESAETIFGQLGINSHYYYAARRKDKFYKFIKSPKFRRGAAVTAIAFLVFFSSFFLYDYSKNVIFGNADGKISSQSSNGAIPIVSSSESTNSFRRISGAESNRSYLTDIAGTAIQIQSIEDYINNKVNSQNKLLAGKYNQREKDLINRISSLENDKNNYSGMSSLNIYNERSADFDLKDVSLSSESVNDFGKSKFLEYNSKNSASKIFERNSIISAPNQAVLNTSLAEMFPKNHKFEISYRMNTPNSITPGINSNLYSDTKQNFELSAGYNLASSHQIGLVVGRDNFPQNFSHVIDGQEYKMMQNPNLYYLGFGYKFTPRYILTQSYLLPFAYTLVSGTAIGPYIKLQGGLELNFISRLSMFVGIENGNLIYNVDNKIYSTNKVNFVYGLNIKL
jgi:hypothetical protein